MSEIMGYPVQYVKNLEAVYEAVDGIKAYPHSVDALQYLFDKASALDQTRQRAPCNHSRQKNGSLYAICKKCGHPTAPVDRGNAPAEQGQDSDGNS